MDFDELNERAAILAEETRTLEGAAAELEKMLDDEEGDDDVDGSAFVPRKPKPYSPAGAASRELEREPELVGV